MNMDKPTTSKEAMIVSHLITYPVYPSTAEIIERGMTVF